MPWLAVPFDVNIRKQLSSRLLIEHIPSLIPLASDGRTAKEDAVQLVEDFGPDAFPFGVERRKELEAVDEAKRHGGKLEELLGCSGRDYVISSDGSKVGRSLIASHACMHSGSSQVFGRYIIRSRRWMAIK